jgi:hypothetical protein
MANEEKEKIEIRTHKIPGARDFWKTWRRGKPMKVISNPQDISIDELPLPAEPPEIQSRRRKEAQRKEAEAQLKAGVGTFASRTAAGMDRAEERAEKVGEEETKRRERDLSSGDRKTSES